MAYLIDSSVFVAIERRGLPLGALAAAMADGPIALASITASELLAVVHRADSPIRRLRRETFVETILDLIPVLPFDLRVARVHAKVWTELTRTGQPIGAHDLLIAATALAHGYEVLTHNLREFGRVSGLICHQPDW